MVDHILTYKLDPLSLRQCITRSCVFAGWNSLIFNLSLYLYFYHSNVRLFQNEERILFFYTHVRFKFLYGRSLRNAGPRFPFQVLAPRTCHRCSGLFTAIANAAPIIYTIQVERCSKSHQLFYHSKLQPLRIAQEVKLHLRSQINTFLTPSILVFAL